MDHRNRRDRVPGSAFRPGSEPLERGPSCRCTPGSPLQETPQTFKGVGTTNAAAALNSLEAAIGGSVNTTPAPQTGGFRNINWDGVATNGTDFGGPPNTLQINKNIANGTVIIPQNRFIGQGVFLSGP